MVRVIQFAFAATAALLGATYAAGTFAQGAPAAPAAAPRENVMKACGDKWRAVREVETKKGVTWPKFLSTCRAQMASSKENTTTAKPSRESASAEASRTEATASGRGSARPAASSASGPVFPRDVATKHASERPALARQRTCADQYKANKAANANGGMKWIEKGGGYWSKCNAHLKQLRA